ncbi:hypothetical protein PALI_a3148 [Pseudoalteromonas aliena SW19]|uniref:Uncharacterized protein n=1 Tax=Pseudoalteromonas aliena SW19 TaxID=1314866 RepID=A0ABR9E384_9GAMM|nr:hypothetical protein [Pseudoalteromonas aliena SW19]
MAAIALFAANNASISALSLNFSCVYPLVIVMWYISAVETQPTKCN